MGALRCVYDTDGTYVYDAHMPGNRGSRPLCEQLRQDNSVACPLAGGQMHRRPRGNKCQLCAKNFLETYGAAS